MKTARVNLRVEQETYDAYEKVASFFNRSVADLMREALRTSVPSMESIGLMIDRAKAGDKEMVQQLFDSIIAMHQGELNLMATMGAAELAASKDQPQASDQGEASASLTDDSAS